MLKNLEELDDDAKVWVYQSDRFLSHDDVKIAKQKLSQFLEAWTSHNRALITAGEFLHNRFLVIAVDEKHADASGCSIDKSVNFIQDLGNELNIDFFNRDQFIYLKNDQISSIKLIDLKSCYANGDVTDETLFFDTLITSKLSLNTQLLKPLSKSWHRRFLR